MEGSEVNHGHRVTVSHKSQLASSILSVFFSFIASSHHWLHMGILFLVGGSTSTLAMTTGILWVRRLMIVITLLTAGFSIRKLYKQKSMPYYMKGFTILSTMISVGFIFYTLITSGW